MGNCLLPVNLGEQEGVDQVTKAIGDWAAQKQIDRSEAALFLPILPGYSTPLSAAAN